MRSVGFLLGHGPRGRRAAARTEALLQPADTVRVIESPEGAETALEEIAAIVPGASVLRVVHLVEVEDAEVRAGLARAAASVSVTMAKYPAVNVRQFVVSLVDREWDENERTTLMQLGPDIAAVFVVSRSNEAAIQLRPVEEECMASDLAYALLASNLDQSLADERFWLAGTSAVYYRRRVILAALVAYHVREFLRENLLRPLAATHTECEEGQQWAREQHLGLAEHLSRLERSAMGGSIISEVRVDRDLFRRVPPEYLVDSLRSFAMQHSDRLVEAARAQIERNCSEHLATEVEELTAATRDILLRTLTSASAERFAECARDALDGPAQELQVALSVAHERDEEIEQEQHGIEEELVRTIRRLPYRAAIMARTAGLGVLGVAGYHALSGLLALDPNFALLGLLAGVLLASPLVAHYQRLRGRISALRDRYLALAEQRVRDRVALAVLEAAAGEVQSLRRAAGEGVHGLRGKLAAMREVFAGLEARYDALVAERAPEDLPATRLSVLVPAPGDIATEVLAHQFALPKTIGLPTLVMRCALAGDAFETPDPIELEQRLLEAISPSLEGVVWADLSTVLRASELTKAAVVALLETPTAPIVRTEELAPDQCGIRRMAMRSEGLADLVQAAAVDGRLLTDDRDSLVQVAIRPVPISMRGVGGGHVEA